MNADFRLSLNEDWTSYNIHLRYLRLVDYLSGVQPGLDVRDIGKVQRRGQRPQPWEWK